MREIFDRHAEGLTPEERRAIWQTISGSLAAEPRPKLRWALSATAAAVVAVAMVAALQRETVVSRRPVTPGPVATSRKVEGAGPSSHPAQSGVERGGAVRGGPRAGVVGAAPPIRPAPMPSAKGIGVAVVPGAAELRPVPPAPSPPVTASMGAVTGRITDAQNQPVAYANVMVIGTRAGTLSDVDGNYRIDRLPAATYSLRVQALGHEKQVVEGLRVEGDLTARADVQVKESSVVQTIEEISVSAGRRIDTRPSTSKQSMSAEKLKELPIDNLREAVGTKAGVVAKGDVLQYRGGRGGEGKFTFDGVEVAPAAPAPQATPATPAVPAPPPVVPTTGGTRLPNDEPYDSMFFKNYGVNPFIPTDEDPLSTFAVDVDAASYTVMRRYIVLGHLPPADAVRVEEFVNFFPQGYPRFGSEDFRIMIDGAPSPFRRGYHLLRIGLKGREIEERNRKPAQLTFVIDVSGSMAREDRLELVKRALRLLVDQLRDSDRIGIVVYGTMGRVLLEPIPLGGPKAGAGRQRILEAIEQLRPEGSTNAEDGLRLGYEMARRGYRPKAINRIVLCSDGVANNGVTGPESILKKVRTEADQGIHLTTIGFGMGNYNDVLMEQLADRGDGNHYYVDDIDEARRVFVENLTGTLQTIAKDAKIQVEFDSTRVLRYRLLGFENRDVADRDFRNDRVDAGEIGGGHEVTALYEVKLAPQATAGTIATARLRYARPDRAGAPEVREIEKRFDSAALARTFEDAAPRFRLDAAVAEFAEILRGSYWAKEGRLSDVLSVARNAASSLGDDTTAEFVSLVAKAAALKEQAKQGQR